VAVGKSISLPAITSLEEKLLLDEGPGIRPREAVVALADFRCHFGSDHFGLRPL
jgi:hypothetical protein